MKSRSDQISWRWQLPSATWVTRGHVYSSCVLSVMLHASETWQLTKKNLQRNDRAMIRQICTIKPEDVATVRSSELLAKLELEDLDLILRERRLRWFGHVELSSGEVRTACDIQIDDRGGGVGEAQAYMEETDGERLPFVCLVALRPKSTAMIMAGRSVHLTTLFPGQT